MTERQKQHRANLRRVYKLWDSDVMEGEFLSETLARLLDKAERRGENRYKSLAQDTADLFGDMAVQIAELNDEIAQLESELARRTESPAEVLERLYKI